MRRWKGSLDWAREEKAKGREIEKVKKRLKSKKKVYFKSTSIVHEAARLSIQLSTQSGKIKPHACPPIRTLAMYAQASSST